MSHQGRIKSLDKYNFTSDPVILISGGLCVCVCVITWLHYKLMDINNEMFPRWFKTLPSLHPDTLAPSFTFPQRMDGKMLFISIHPSIHPSIHTQTPPYNTLTLLKRYFVMRVAFLVQILWYSTLYFVIFCVHFNNYFWGCLHKIQILITKNINLTV